ncbi:MAG: pyruvate ferredoxin oxidoreductase, partial [Candidatus Bathyarchaeota archaeon]|nr:pyruvate ferredoxin oxidoreductase [Candidatus Bathyarchaeota archaeon]
MEGFLATEIKASLLNQKDPPLVAGFIAGLGGRDVTFDTIGKIAKKSLKWMRGGKVERETEWVDLRE